MPNDDVKYHNDKEEKKVWLTIGLSFWIFHNENNPAVNGKNEEQLKRSEGK